MTAATPAARARRHAVPHDLRVAAVDPLTDDSVAITFDVPDELAADYDFVHGQHVSLRCAPAGDDVRRAYSVCTPAGSGVLRVAVKRLPGGAFSTYAHTALRAGDVVEVMTPVGRFTAPVDPARARSHVAVAAGSGIAPILSIVATLLAGEPRSDVALVYGNRTAHDVMFLEELEDLKNRYPSRFALHVVLSREPRDADILSGRVDGPRLEALLGSPLLPVHVDEWFLCGPAAMIASLRSVLAAHGVDGSRVHAELFHAQARSPSGDATAVHAGTPQGAATVTVLLDGRASTVSVPSAGESILDAALRVRSDAPYACR
ncbi:MAG TPA: FAD-binding oxidoreductase, partial [Candidatus Dormibacteraeota bacterium]|nr:FAD-binding oxidoreductase [Candidatus Dormibacteraeota bacterium]